MELNEGVIENMVAKSIEGLLLETMSTDEIYTKYYSDIDKSVFDAAVKADPTSDADHAGRYVKWILGLYKRGNWKPGDSYETKDALSKFHRLRNNLEIKDINGYKSVRQLIDAVSDKKSTSDIKRSGAEKVYEDGEWLVIVPHTEEASKLYGKGTKWCTAADNDNYFDYYNDQGPLYINIRKRDGEKWQFHLESRSFMDAEDDPVSIKDIGLSDGLVRFYEKVCPYFKALFEYDYVGGFNEGFAPVDVDGMCNFIDTNGNLVSSDQWFDGCCIFDEGFARVRVDGKWNYLGTEGNILSPGQWFDRCCIFDEGFARVKVDGKWNLIDTNGNLLSPDQWFDDAYGFNGKIANVKLDGKLYCIDREGNLYDESRNLIKRNNRSNDNLINEALSVNDVYSKYYPDIDKSVFDAAVKADPTSDADHAGRYVKWILGLYKKGNWKPGDSYETKDALSKFHRLRNSLEIKDINGYKSVRQLLDAVSDKQSSRDVKKSGAEKVYEDNEWLIVIPETEEASKLYGMGTKWCTAADKENMFDYYNEKGPLFINIRKKDGQKWQFNFETNSFMDSEDDEVNPYEIGLDEGAVKYYMSIGHGKDLLPFDEAVQYCLKHGDFDYVSDQRYNVRLVKFREKYNFLKSNGELLWDGEWFDNYYFPWNDFCGVFYNGKGYNFLNPDGELVWKGDKWFKSITSFYDGLARVIIDGVGYNFLKTNGELLWHGKQQITFATNFKYGFAKVNIGGGEYKLSRNGDLYTFDESKRVTLESVSNRKVILNEEQSWQLCCETMSSNEIREKYYQDVPNFTFTLAMKADPTSKPGHPGKYVKWILNLWRNKSWTPIEWERTNMVLKRFDKAKPHMDEQDINHYKSMDELEDAIDSVDVPDSSTDIKNKGSEKVYEDDKWLVIRIDTWEASKLYGAGTKWCTSEDKPDAFDAYNSNGKLYLNIRKTDKSKFLLFLSNSGYGTEFKDATDHDTSFGDIDATKGLVEFYRAMEWKPDTAAKRAGLMESSELPTTEVTGFPAALIKTKYSTREAILIKTI